jgi:predicted N-acetyltransferase YhbS
MTALSLVAPEPALFSITPELHGHGGAVQDLHDVAFGPGRFVRTAYRVRGANGHDRDLSFVAFSEDRLVGAVWQTRVMVGAARSILLGPIAVHPDLAGRGCGVALLGRALEAARAAGAPSVVLVGDAPYYARVGFAPVPHRKIGWPGPVDPARVLAVAFAEGAVENLVGPIRAARWGDASAALAAPGQADAAE